jgi:capsular exopolysaccharide synthesis family protein
LALVKNYNEIQLNRLQQIHAGAGPQYPLVTEKDQQVSRLRNDIKVNTANLLRSAQSAATTLQHQNQDFNNKIRSVPKIQREYINIKRQQDIKQTLYLYLLQKREEAAITEAANVSNSRIVDPAHTGIVPIAPKRQLIYLAAFLLGLALPGGLIYLKDLLNRKISSRQEVESQTQTPVYAEIGHSKDPGPIIVSSGNKGAVPEQFRNLRTNLSFVLGTDTHKVILVTSSMGGEGKSFISLNLAMTYSLMGKRTVLVDMDLRKPRLSAYLGLDHRAGISNYLSGQLPVADLIITLDKEKDPLYFIGSGPVPPNPSELFLQPSMEGMITEFKKQYDYIIIDTPPVGLVTDAQIIGKYADASLYVVRNGFTFKDQIRLIDSYYQGKRFPHLGIVLNDIKAGEAYRYGYGGYGYGYGDGYYSENGNGKAGKKLYKRIKDENTYKN